MANLGGRDVAGNGGEQVHRGFSQGDFMRVVRRSAIKFFRGNHETQSLDAKSGTAGDDEIAAVEQGFVVFPRRNFQKLVSSEHEVQMIVGVLAAEAAHRFVSVKDVRRRAVQGSLRKRWNERRV